MQNAVVRGVEKVDGAREVYNLDLYSSICTSYIELFVQLEENIWTRLSSSRNCFPPPVLFTRRLLNNFWSGRSVYERGTRQPTRLETHPVSNYRSLLTIEPSRRPLRAMTSASLNPGGDWSLVRRPITLTHRDINTLHFICMLIICEAFTNKKARGSWELTATFSINYSSVSFVNMFRFEPINGLLQYFNYFYQYDSFSSMKIGKLWILIILYVCTINTIPYSEKLFWEIQ